VPLLVSGPAVTQPGREVAALACAVDVFKTVIDLADAGAGLPPILPNDSVSLVPYLNDPQQAPIRQYAYTEQFNGTAWPDPMNNGHATIRDARYKLIHRYSGGGDELFDLQLDPWETNNLINSSDPAIQQAKLDLLAQIMELNPDDADYHATYGWLLFSKHDGAESVQLEAIAALERAIALSPDHDKSHYYLGMILKRAGRVGEAATHFAKAAEINPRHIEAVREVRLANMRKSESPASRKSGRKSRSSGLLGKLFGGDKK